MDVSILNSDYRSPGGVVRRLAALEFLLVQVVENCSFTSRCGFEAGEVSSGFGGCAGWEVGGGARIIDQALSPPSLQDPFTGGGY